MKESVMKRQNSRVQRIRPGEEHSAFHVNGYVMETQIVWMERMKIPQHLAALLHQVALQISSLAEMADASIGYASSNIYFCTHFILGSHIEFLHFTHFCHLLLDK